MSPGEMPWNLFAGALKDLGNAVVLMGCELSEPKGLVGKARGGIWDGCN